MSAIVNYNDSNYLSSTQKCKACTATGGNIRKLLSGECNAYGHSAELLKMLLEKLNNQIMERQYSKKLCARNI